MIENSEWVNLTGDFLFEALLLSLLCFLNELSDSLFWNE